MNVETVTITVTRNSADVIPHKEVLLEHVIYADEVFGGDRDLACETFKEVKVEEQHGYGGASSPTFIFNCLHQDGHYTGFEIGGPDRLNHATE